MQNIFVIKPFKNKQGRFWFNNFVKIIPRTYRSTRWARWSGKWTWIRHWALNPARCRCCCNSANWKTVFPKVCCCHRMPVCRSAFCSGSCCSGRRRQTSSFPVAAAAASVVAGEVADRRRFLQEKRRRNLRTCSCDCRMAGNKYKMWIKTKIPIFLIGIL